MSTESDAKSNEARNPNFKVSERWRFLYSTLCKNGPISRDIGYSIFDKYTQLFSLAAAFGYAVNKRNTIKDGYTPFHLREIEHDYEWSALKALAWKANNCDLDVVTDNRKVIKTCEELADGGMEYLYDEFFKIHVKEERLLHPENIGIEKNLAWLIKGLKCHRI